MGHTSLKKNNIFCIWSGHNEMSDNRKRCLKSLIDHSQCEVNLINPSNLSEYIVKDNPLHQCYEHLSLTHKADYLRVYLMYHYGGGYSDIKMNKFNWLPFFEFLENSDKAFVGYKELHADHIATKNSLIKQNFMKLPGVVHFIFKKQSVFAKHWLLRIHSILDNKSQDLKENPGHYHPRAIYGGAFQTDLFKQSKYPLGWNEILAIIFHEMSYYNQQTYECIMPFPNLNNYR